MAASVGTSIMKSYKPKMKMPKVKAYKAASQGVGAPKPKVKNVKVRGHKLKP